MIWHVCLVWPERITKCDTNLLNVFVVLLTVTVTSSSGKKKQPLGVSISVKRSWRIIRGDSPCEHKWLKQLRYPLTQVWTTVLFIVTLDTTHTVGCVYCLCSSSRKGVTVFPPTLTVNDRWKLSCSNPPHPSTHQPPQFSPRAPIRLLQLLRWRLHLMSETLSQMFAEHLEGPRRIHTSSLFRSLRTRFL